MTMTKKLKALPKFKNEDEERDFWDKANLTDYFNPKDFKRVSFPNLKMSNFWFITWNRPEYKEWAQKKLWLFIDDYQKATQRFWDKGKLVFKAKFPQLSRKNFKKTS